MANKPDTSSESTRQTILQATRRLFTEHGVDNTSLKDIARASGISPGTLFYYYPSKAELIFDVTDQYFDQVTAGLLEWAQAAEQLNDLQSILKVVFSTIINDLERGKLHHYLVEEAVSCNEPVRNRFGQKYQEWQQMIESGIAAYVPQPGRRTVLAQLILAALDGLVLQNLVGRQNLSVEALAAEMAALITLPAAG
jgi:AcrR family transcriptional regulator